MEHQKANSWNITSIQWQCLLKIKSLVKQIVCIGGNWPCRVQIWPYCWAKLTSSLSFLFFFLKSQYNLKTRGQMSAKYFTSTINIFNMYQNSHSLDRIKNTCTFSYMNEALFLIYLDFQATWWLIAEFSSLLFQLGRNTPQHFVYQQYISITSHFDEDVSEWQLNLK